MGYNRAFLIAPAVSSLMPRKKKAEANEKKHEEYGDILFISQGQDIGEEVLTYFRNRTNRSQNSNGHSRIGWIMSANGLVFHPILENSSTTAEGLYDMIRLEGRYTISEDGEVQQCGPLTIFCADPSHVVYGGHVIGRLIAAEAIQKKNTRTLEYPVHQSRTGYWRRSCDLFRNRTKRWENSNGRAQKGMIMSAFGQVLNPILGNTSASDEGSCFINSLGGTFFISADGEVQQSGPLTISYYRPNWGVGEGQVTRLVAAGHVQVVVAWQLSI